jgi:hypothetical protein
VWQPLGDTRRLPLADLPTTSRELRWDA